jgi:enediyne biosynthesis protein E4
VNGLVRRLTPGQSPVLPGVDPWWARYAQRPQFFVNEGAGHFRDRSADEAALCGPSLVGRSIALADFDGDGATDLVVAGVGGPARILRNVAPGRGHWLRVRLIDPTKGGRDAIGSEVTIRAATGKQWWSVLQPATGYLVSHEPVVHVGLGSVDALQSIEVLWPDGRRERFPGGKVDQTVNLRAGAGQGIGAKE